MRYSNTSINAVLELENQRTGNYGMDYEDEEECVDDLSFIWEEAEYGEDVEFGDDEI